MMNGHGLHESVKKGEIFNQYLLIGDEPLLIDNALKLIKDALKLNEAFDLDVFSLSETSTEEICTRLFMTPFGSACRMIIVKNLEEIDMRELSNFAELIKNAKNNCLVMTYKIRKGMRKTDDVVKRVAAKFPDAKCVTLLPERNQVHKWILSKINRDQLNLSSSMIHYLEEEFNDDITGLKNEFEKIENYLYEAKELDHRGIRDLAKGLCDFDKYRVVHAFLEGKQEAVGLYEELRPYLHSNAEMVDALTRGLVYHFRRTRGSSNKNLIQELLNKLTMLDRKIKTSSYFSHLILEILMLEHSREFRKEVLYGK